MMPSVFARFRPAPLSSGFFLASILGLLVTLFYFDELAATRAGKSFALVFIILFVAMFIASVISMRRAPAGAQMALDYHLAKSALQQAPTYRPMQGAAVRPAKQGRSAKKKAKPAKRKMARPKTAKRRGARTSPKTRQTQKKSAKTRPSRRRRR